MHLELERIFNASTLTSIRFHYFDQVTLLMYLIFLKGGGGGEALL